MAADETVGTIAKRFDQSWKFRLLPRPVTIYREMLFTTPQAASFISGAITYDETIRQLGVKGEPIPKILEKEGVMAGIKVGTGAKPLASCEGETVTAGLDGLRERLKEYHSMGARFARRCPADC